MAGDVFTNPQRGEQVQTIYLIQNKSFEFCRYVLHSNPSVWGLILESDEIHTRIEDLGETHALIKI